MKRFSHQDRETAIAAGQDTTYDIVVVGGGITGAGAAFEAANRGLKTALVEKEDWGAGTSSKSSKLIHGGLRYLEQMEFALVMESTAERALLMKHASHLARPLRFVYPVYKSHKHRPWFIRLGMWLYDMLSLFRNYRAHQQWSPARIQKEEPNLKQDELLAAMAYYDCMTDDARLTLENAIAAHRAGATVLSRVEFKTHEENNGVYHLTCEDRWTSKTFVLRTRSVLVAAGPWTNAVLGQAMPKRKSPVRPTKGVHLVVPQSKLPVNSAIVLSAVRDGRVTFIIPWEESTVIGTTDTDFTGDVDSLHPTADDVQYLLETANAYFPDVKLNTSDVLSTWTGLRPLVADDSDNPYNTSREHEIFSEGGIFAVAGGKLTTYRKMAEECVDSLARYLGEKGKRETRTCIDASLPGAEGFAFETDGPAAIARAVEEFGLQKEAATRLVERYGVRWESILTRYGGDHPGELLDPSGRVLLAEVRYSAEEEMVGSLEDFLVRRTHLFYHLKDQGLGCAPAVAEILGNVFEWTPERIAEEVEAYSRCVALNRVWKNDAGESPHHVGQRKAG